MSETEDFARWLGRLFGGDAGLLDEDEAVELLDKFRKESKTGPVLGDVHLSIDLHGNAEVWVEVDGRWRVAIKEHGYQEGNIVSHFVCTDGDKPNAWPLACVEEQNEAGPPWPSVEECLKPGRGQALAARIHREAAGRKKKDRCKACGLERGFHGPVLVEAGDPQCNGFVEPECVTCGDSGYAPHEGDPANGPEPCPDCGPF